MNERIDQLVEQANIETLQDRAGYLYHKAWPEDLENFAELLVKECALIGNRGQNDENEIRSVYDVIISHFGVK